MFLTWQLHDMVYYQDKDKFCSAFLPQANIFNILVHNRIIRLHNKQHWGGILFGNNWRVWILIEKGIWLWSHEEESQHQYVPILHIPDVWMMAYNTISSHDYISLKSTSTTLPIDNLPLLEGKLFWAGPKNATFSWVEPCKKQKKDMWYITE